MGRALVKFNPSEEEIKMIDDLKEHFKTSTRAKVVRKCLKQTHEIVKNLWGEKL